MNRWMLGVVGLLVLGGLAIWALNGPSMVERIAAADSCSELGALYDELRAEVGDVLDTNFQRRAVALGC
jgi:hypothetical protein